MTSFHRPRFTDDELATLLEAVECHCLTAPKKTYSKTQAETHRQMVAMRSRLSS